MGLKPYHCHKLIQNDINKMGILQTYIQNSVKHEVLFLKVDNGWKLWSSFAKRTILDVWQGFEYASVF